MEQHFTGKVATKAIITRGGEVLMTRRKVDLEIFDLPGGRIDVGENLETALKREAAEELGVDIKIDGLIHSEQFLHTEDQSSILFIILKATLVNPETSFNALSDELAEIRWVKKDMLQTIKMYGSCTRALKKYWDLE